MSLRSWFAVEGSLEPIGYDGRRSSGSRKLSPHMSSSPGYDHAHVLVFDVPFARP